MQKTASVNSMNSFLHSANHSRMGMMNMVMMQNQAQHFLTPTQSSHTQHSQTAVQKEELDSKWSAEFAKHEQQSEILAAESLDSITDNKFQDKYEKIWEDLSNYSELLRRQSDYIFVAGEKNHLMTLPNPYEAGMEILKQGGKLSEAILCFEAAVQQEPSFLDAWKQLGTCQIKNEMEWQGITALEQALSLQNSSFTGSVFENKTVASTVDITVELGTCYINTGMDLMAFKLFEKWIQQNYDRWLSDYSEVEETVRNEALLSGEELSINRRVLNMFEHVSAKNPLALKDKSFQVIQGLLNYCIDNYDMTIISFQRALELDTQDEVLWNRLGATLANHGRPEDAVHAYKRALEIKPSFVRGRYNLAISLMRIGWFKESVESFFTCLKLLQTESDVDRNQDKNSSIVDGLNNVFRMMNRPDLLDKLSAYRKGDLTIDTFKQEFKF